MRRLHAHRRQHEHFHLDIARELGGAEPGRRAAVVRVLRPGPATGDATAVERVVHTVAERHAAALVTGVPAECRAGVYRQLFARVVVGATPDDVTVTWRA